METTTPLYVFSFSTAISASILMSPFEAPFFPTLIALVLIGQSLEVSIRKKIGIGLVFAARVVNFATFYVRNPESAQPVYLLSDLVRVIALADSNVGAHSYSLVVFGMTPLCAINGDASSLELFFLLEVLRKCAYLAIFAIHRGSGSKKWIIYCCVADLCAVVAIRSLFHEAELLLPISLIVLSVSRGIWAVNWISSALVFCLGLATGIGAGDASITTLSCVGGIYTIATQLSGRYHATSQHPSR